MNTPSTKRCCVCQEDFPATVEYFHPRPDSPDGLRNNCRVCQNKRSKKYHADNTDDLKAYHLKYYQENRDRLQQKQRDYEAQNRERARKRVRLWKLANPERVKNREARNQASAISRRIRREARKSALPDNFTPQDWRFAIDYFGGRCAACGRPPGLFHTLAADHFMALSSLGCPGSVPANIVPLCHGVDGCNNSKFTADPEEWLIRKFGKKQGKAILAKIQEFFSKVRQV